MKLWPISIAVVLSISFFLTAQNDFYKKSHQFKLGTALAVYGLYGMATRNWFFNVSKAYGLKKGARYSIAASLLNNGSKTLSGVYLMYKYYPSNQPDLNHAFYLNKK